MTTEARLVYITAPSQDDAVKLAQAIVGDRLAACANVLGAITSVYWWDGKVNQDGEVAVVFKTRADLVETLTARVRELHPYDCPCVVSLPIDGGNPDFLAWIASETRP